MPDQKLLEEDPSHPAVSVDEGVDHLELVEDLDRSRRLWDLLCLPYDLEDWYQGPGDPSLLWIEIDPIRASLHRNFGEGGSSLWRRSQP